MRSRPNLYTTYSQESQMLPTWTQKMFMGLFLFTLFVLPFDFPFFSGGVPGLEGVPLIGKAFGDGLPLARFLGDSDWIRPMTGVMVLVVAALGLNILSGVAGQVSLGHAFFMGVGACTAVFLGGTAGSSTYGHGLPIWIWLPGAGVMAALVGIAVSPVAV